MPISLYIEISYAQLYEKQDSCLGVKVYEEVSRSVFQDGELIMAKL